MIKHPIILLISLPAHVFSGTTESTLKYILDYYQARIRKLHNKLDIVFAS